MRRKTRSADDHRRIGRDGRRAVLVVVLLIFAIAAMLPYFTKSDTSGGAVGRETRVSSHKTGSVVIAPSDGNICEHRLIDNETWRIRSSGSISCDRAGSSQALQTNGASPSSRIDAIRGGFFPKK